MDAAEIVQEESSSKNTVLQGKQPHSACAQELYAFSTNSRPPPPGEDSKESEKAKNWRLESLKREKLSTARATPRRSTKDGSIRTECTSEEDTLAPLGFEPEGSAAGTPLFERWANCLQDLMSDPEGFSLFYDYLRQESCELLLDFWRSCEGFRRMVPTSYRMLAAAKAIYLKFIQSRSVPILPIRDATRTKIARHHVDQPVDSSLFDEATSEVLAHIKNSYYPKFLKSDIYRNYAENLKELPKDHHKQGGSRMCCGYLPTLPEEKECGFVEELCEFDEESSKYATKAKFGKYLNLLSTGKKAGTEDSAGLYLQKNNKGLSASLYPTNAPVGSINDSESQSLSSDAITDDATSIADSTVTDESGSRCRHGHEKSHGKDCVWSRGGLPLPSHFVPRTQRLPKDRYPLPPDEFAKVLIEKLEKVKQERELQDREAVNLAASGISYEGQCAGEKKKSILEEAIESHKEKSKKLPLDLLASCVCPNEIEKEQAPVKPAESTPVCTSSSKSTTVAGQSAASVSSKHTNDTAHNVDRAKCEQLNVRATDRTLHLSEEQRLHKDNSTECNTVSSMNDSGFALNEIPTCNLDHDRILQWMEQGEKYQLQEDTVRRVRHHHHHHSQSSSSSSHPRASFKSKHGLPRPLEQLNQYTPTQPIAQDPLMPPLPQPEAINVIEEAKRRLQESKEERKQRSHHKSSRSRHYKEGSVYTGSSSSCCCSGTDSSSCSRSVMSYDHRCTNSSFGSSNLSSIQSSASNVYSDTKSHDSGIGSSRKKSSKEQHHTTITYWLPREPIPYRTSLPGRNITLQQFKGLVAHLVAKKGELRFFFKKMTEDQDCAVVYEELKDDNSILPMYEGKIVGKISKVDM